MLTSTALCMNNFIYTVWKHFRISSIKEQGSDTILVKGIPILLKVIRVEAVRNTFDEYCVAASVLNRVNSKVFPNSVYEKLFMQRVVEVNISIKDLI